MPWARGGESSRTTCNTICSTIARYVFVMYCAVLYRSRYFDKTHHTDIWEYFPELCTRTTPYGTHYLLGSSSILPQLVVCKLIKHSLLLEFRNVREKPSFSVFLFFSFFWKSTGTRRHCSPNQRSSRSSSSSAQPFLLLTTIFSSSFLSATALRSSLSCSSVTFCRSWPDCASMISRFSTSVARDSLTIRMRPNRSMASGCRIWFRMLVRASAA